MCIIMHVFVCWGGFASKELLRWILMRSCFSVACHCLYSPCGQVLTKMYNGSVHATVELLTCSGQELRGLESFRSGQAWQPRLKWASSIFVRCCQFSPLLCDIIYLADCSCGCCFSSSFSLRSAGILRPFRSPFANTIKNNTKVSVAWLERETYFCDPNA